MGSRGRDVDPASDGDPFARLNCDSDEAEALRAGLTSAPQPLTRGPAAGLYGHKARAFGQWQEQLPESACGAALGNTEGTRLPRMAAHP